MAFPAGWGRKAPVTISSTQVSALLTDFPLLCTTANLPSEMFDADGSFPARSDGGDVRFTSDEDGTTQIAVEVVTFGIDNNPANGDAQIWTLVPSVSASVDTVIWVWWNAPSETMPAAASTYGSQAVWADYAAVWHCEDASGNLTDSTANANDLTPDAGGLTYGVTGKIGNAIDFSGGVFSKASALVSAYPFTFQAWSEPDSANANISILSVGDTNANESATIRHALSADTVAQSRTVSNGFSTAAAVGVTVPDAWQLVHGVFAGDSDRAVLHNGGSKATNNGSAPVSGWDLTMVGARANGTGQLTMNGAIEEARIRNDDLADAWMASEHTSHDAPGTFASAGTPETPGGGVEVNVRMPRGVMRGVLRGVLN